MVSARAVAVDARELLLEATTGEGALKLGAQVITIRIENTYEQGGALFWVDAQIAWSSEPTTLTIANDAEPQVDYDVQAYLVHRHNADAPVSSGMQSGHYLAYFKHGATWYLADDDKVTLLASPPTEFPYLVFLARCDRARGAHATSMQKRLRDISSARRRAPQLEAIPTATTSSDQSRMAGAAASSAASARDASKRDQSGRVRE